MEKQRRNEKVTSCWRRKLVWVGLALCCTASLLILHFCLGLGSGYHHQLQLPFSLAHWVGYLLMRRTLAITYFQCIYSFCLLTSLPRSPIEIIYLLRRSMSNAYFVTGKVVQVKPSESFAKSFRSCFSYSF